MPGSPNQFEFGICHREDISGRITNGAIEGAGLNGRKDRREKVGEASEMDVDVSGDVILARTKYGTIIFGM